MSSTSRSLATDKSEIALLEWVENQYDDDEFEVYELDLDEFTRALSRKTRKPDQLAFKEDEIDTFDDFIFDIDAITPDSDMSKKALDHLSSAVKKIQWPVVGEDNKGSDSEHLVPLLGLLNSCLNAWRDSGLPMEHKLYKGLRFVQISGPSSLKDCTTLCPLSFIPCIVGVNGSQENIDELWWNPPDTTKARQIHIPVLMRSKDRELHIEGGAYATCLFSANPMRQFCLILAFNYSTQELMFLDEDDAGIPLFFNNKEIILPQDGNDEEGVLYSASEMICSDLDLQGRGCYVFRVSQCDKNDLKSIPVASNGLSSEEKEDKSKDEENTTDPKETRDFGADLTNIIKPANADFKKRKAGVLSSDDPDAATIRKRPALDSEEPQQPAESSTTASDPPNSSDALPTIAGDNTRIDVSGFPKHAARPTRHVKPIYFNGPSSAESPNHPEEDKPTSQATEGSSVIKFTWQIRGQKYVEADVLKACSGKFGNPVYKGSFPVYTKTGVVMSNDLFIPLDQRKKERRVPWIHFTDFVGRDLDAAETLQDLTPLKLFKCIFHSMLGSLGMLYGLYLHRDISGGNVMMPKEPLIRRPFEVRYRGEGKKGDDDWEEQYRLLETDAGPSSDEAEEQVKRLQGILERLEVSQECHGIVIDGDNACDLRTHFADGPSKKSGDYIATGTRPYMSDALLRHGGGPPHVHLHGPVDDLWSFFYVCQGTAAHRPVSSGGIRLPEVCKMLRNDEDGLFHYRSFFKWIGDEDIPEDESEELFGSFITKCRPIMQEWHASLSKLQCEWDDDVQTKLSEDCYQNLREQMRRRTDSKETGTKKLRLGDLYRDPEKMRVFCIRNFIAFARKGVADFGEIFERNMVTLSASK